MNGVDREKWTSYMSQCKIKNPILSLPKVVRLSLRLNDLRPKESNDIYIKMINKRQMVTFMEQKESLIKI